MCGAAAKSGCGDNTKIWAHIPQFGDFRSTRKNILCTWRYKLLSEPSKPCTRCSIGPKELLPCSLENDVNEFKSCSACCNNDRDVHVEQCAEQRMPNKFKYSYTNRGGSACGHQRSEERKSISPVLLVVAVGIVILVTIVSSVLYQHLKCCKHVTIVLDECNSLFISPEEKGGGSCPSKF